MITRDPRERRQRWIERAKRERRRALIGRFGTLLIILVYMTTVAYIAGWTR